MYLSNNNLLWCIENNIYSRKVGNIFDFAINTSVLMAIKMKHMLINMHSFCIANNWLLQIQIIFNHE